MVIHVQFGPGGSEIIAVFAGPQDPMVYPDLGTVEAHDARYEAFYAGLPPSIQRWLVAPEK